MTGVKRTRKQTLNSRQRKFIKNYVSGLGVGQSALRANYKNCSEGTALLKNPTVITALHAALEKAGISDEYIANKHKEGLEATYPEKLSKDGKVMQAGGQPDFFTRAIYLDKTHKVRGDYAPERHIQEQRTLTINVNMDMARGLVDCGVIDAEIVKELNGENDGRPGNEVGSLLSKGGEAKGIREGQEDSDKPEAVCEEAEHPRPHDDAGGASEEGQ